MSLWTLIKTDGNNQLHPVESPPIRFKTLAETTQSWRSGGGEGRQGQSLHSVSGRMRGRLRRSDLHPNVGMGYLRIHESRLADVASQAQRPDRGLSRAFAGTVPPAEGDPRQPEGRPQVAQSGNPAAVRRRTAFLPRDQPAHEDFGQRSPAIPVVARSHEARAAGRADAVSDPAGDDEVSEWRDVKTAPKIGHAIIYDPRWGVCEGNRYDDGHWGLATFNGQITEAHPTHWMPLPDVPK